MRSPLQELEDKYNTKEMKRKKALEAEQRVKQRRSRRQSRDDQDTMDPQPASNRPPMPVTQLVTMPNGRQTAAIPIMAQEISQTSPITTPQVEEVIVPAVAVEMPIQRHRSQTTSVNRRRSQRTHEPKAARYAAAAASAIAPTYTGLPRSRSPDSDLSGTLTDQSDVDSVLPAVPNFTRRESAHAKQRLWSKARFADSKLVDHDPRHLPANVIRRHRETVKQNSISHVQPTAHAAKRVENHVVKEIPLPIAPLEEWRKQTSARLTLDDLALDGAIVKSQSLRKSKHSRKGRTPSQTKFDPPLDLECGPLLRYVGLRRERRARPGHTAIIEREIWRGTVMIVTVDSNSAYSTVPSLALFAQPQESLPSPISREDPVTGQTTASRTGQTLYVRPAAHLPHYKDLSSDKTGRGLLDTQPIEPEEGAHVQPSRSRVIDGEQAGKVRRVNAIRLHQERGMTFWRFSLEVELGTTSARVAYRINNGPPIGFWVPARNQTMRTMFYTCNGFHGNASPDLFSGPDPLWRDVLNSDQRAPYHVMIGGGNQIRSDGIVQQTHYFGQWTEHKTVDQKRNAMFSRQMQDELEEFYLRRYCIGYSQGLFSVANAQIPMVNMWDDHELISGYGSYSPHLMQSKVLTGLGAVAFKYYMLFQHHSLVAETYEHEPSWLLGASPGPYVHQYSRSLFMCLGRKMALLALDCRTERTRNDILSDETYQLILARCRSEIIKGETRHLIVVMGSPIAYPRPNLLEDIVASTAKDSSRIFARSGASGGLVEKIDGGGGTHADMNDHWTARQYKKERAWFVQELQELAAEKSVRVTFLGGAVQLAAVGRFSSPESHDVPKDEDHRYMPNVISSAIVDAPQSHASADMLNKRNKVHHLDAQTDEAMCPIFTHDVDGSPLKNVHLLPRRNYCTISEYYPGATPAPSVLDAPIVPRVVEHKTVRPPRRSRQYPPGSMGHAEPSATLRPRSFIRRLSGSRERSVSGSLRPEHIRAYSDSQPVDLGVTPSASRRGSLSSFLEARSLSRSRQKVQPDSERASNDAASVFSEEDSSAVDLEGGLDVSLHVEVEQGSRFGITKPYRILVPALWYRAVDERETRRYRPRRASILERIRRRAGSRQRNRHATDASYSYSESGSRSPSPTRQKRESETAYVATSQARTEINMTRPQESMHTDTGDHDSAQKAEQSSRDKESRPLSTFDRRRALRVSRHTTKAQESAHGISGSQAHKGKRITRALRGISQFSSTETRTQRESLWV